MKKDVVYKNTTSLHSHTAFGDKQADGRYDMRPSRIKYYVHKIPHLMFTFTS